MVYSTGISSFVNVATFKYSVIALMHSGVKCIQVVEYPLQSLNFTDGNGLHELLILSNWTE